MGQLPPPRREQALLRLPQLLPVVASDAMAAEEVPAAELVTDQATVLGAPLGRPRRGEVSLARRGRGDPIPIPRSPHPLAVGGHRNRTGHHPAGDRRCLTSVTIG